MGLTGERGSPGVGTIFGTDLEVLASGHIRKTSCLKVASAVSCHS